MKAAAFLLDLIFPPRCVFCHGLLPPGTGESVCPACVSRLPRFPGTGKAEFVEAILSPFPYRDDVAASILRYKFGGRDFYAATYARYMAERLRESEVEFELLSWVPLHARRRRQRGYDQAWLLCREVGKLTGAAPTPLLRKIRNAPPQTRESGAERRRANISGCYALYKGAEVEGKRILLVDDVYTTGATLSECARVLLMAGAEEVCALTVANAHK